MTQIQENKLPEWWIEITLWEICEIKWWKRLPKWENLVNYKTNHPYIRITDLENNSINKKQLQFVTDWVFSSISRYIVNSWDVIISIVWSVWFVAKIDDDLDNSSLTENCVKLVNLKNLDSIYLYYYLISQLGQNEIQKNTVWAVQKKLPIYWVQNISLSLPPLPEQQAIAKILSSFDDKIELLREQNETLEKIWQEIFKEWFGKYKVWDELPEGWRIYKLDELVESINWYSYKWSELIDESNEALVTLKSFDRNWWFQTRWFKPFRWNPKDTQEVKVWDLVVAHTDLTQDAEVLWNPAFIFNDWWFEKMFITMDLVKVNSKNINITNALLYYLMKSKEFKWHCVWYSSWTTVLHLSKKAIPNYEIALPEKLDKLSILSVLLEKNIWKIIINNLEIETLSKTRDELLPKLMKGEVRVV